jgi:hypothetical protein
MAGKSRIELRPEDAPSDGYRSVGNRGCVDPPKHDEAEKRHRNTMRHGL